MNNEKALLLIEKLINKTKTNSIIWETLDSSGVELLPSSEVDLSTFTSSFFSSSVTHSKSYVCNWNGGYFFLLVYSCFGVDNKLVLRVQTQDEIYSKLYASTKPDDTSSPETQIKISSQLKRLYNLVSSNFAPQNIENFIDSFIDSE